MLSVIIPVFNEEKTIATVIERVLAVPLDLEIIVVNDASSDGSTHIVDKLAGPSVKVLHHPFNSGKGAAIRTALQVVTGDVVVVQDADFEYDPQDLPRLVEPVTSGKADVVYGIRSLITQKAVMRFGNAFVTAAANILYGSRLKDVLTCYKVMRSDIARSLDLECLRFDVEVEITAKLLRSGYVILELPVSYVARYENKKLSPYDGFPAILALWKYRRWNTEYLSEGRVDFMP